MTIYYGGGEYGSIGPAGENQITPIGIVYLEVSSETKTGSITPAGSVVPALIDFSESQSGSISLSGSVAWKVGKYFRRELIPHTNDITEYFGEGYPENVIEKTQKTGNILFNNYIDGLTKKVVLKQKVGIIKPAGRVYTERKFKINCSGSVALNGTLFNKIQVLHTKSIDGTVQTGKNFASDTFDSNDIDSLISANAQQVLPKVSAYWSTGKFTTNLVGFSSSDVYQKKTTSLNPVVYWKFDELAPPNDIFTIGKGKTSFSTLDSGENNYDGTYVGAVGGVLGALQGPDSGKYALSLTGSGFVKLNSNSDINLIDNFQVECWIKIPSAPPYEMFIFSKGIGASNNDNQYGLSITGSSYAKAYAYSGATEYSVVGGTNIDPNTWYHIILSVENQELKLIVNGIEDGTPVSLGGDVNISSGQLEVGRSFSGSNYFIGYIDEFAIFDGVKILAGGGAYARYRSGINTGTNTFSDRFFPEQIMNGNTRVSFLWGVTDVNDEEGNVITANGQFYTMEDNDSFRYEHGWWSRSISDQDGKMPFIETIVCQFDLHPANRIDVYTSEYFTSVNEFDLYYLDSNYVWNKISDGATIGKNDYKIVVPLNETPIYIRGIRVDVKSIWSANDVARIQEVDPTYVSDISDDVVSIDGDSNRENFDSNIPIGSASANSLTMTLNNTDATYSAFNYSGPYYGLILPDVRFEYGLEWQGIEPRYVSQGVFWADVWQESSSSMTVEVQCRDFTKFLQETTTTGEIWFDIYGADAVGNLLKELNFPAKEIKYDLSYVDTLIRKSAAGAWMMHESKSKKYALAWNEEDIDQYVNGIINNGPDGDFSLCFWIKHPQTNEAPGIIDFSQWGLKGEQSSDRVFIWNPKSIVVSIGKQDYWTSVSVTDNQWHLIAITWEQSSGQIKVYKDGILASYSTVAAGNFLGGVYNLYLGGATQWGNFNGSLGHIVLFDSILDQNDIISYNYRNLMRSEAGVKINYNFSEGLYNIDTKDLRIHNTVSAKDMLRSVNVEIVEEDYALVENFTGKVSGTYYGEVDIGSEVAAFALEPYNRSAFFYGDSFTALFFDGISSPYIQTPSSPIVNVYEDIDVFMQLSLMTFTPNSSQYLYTQSKPSTSNKSFAISLEPSGAITVSYSTDGDNFVDKTTSVCLQNKNLRVGQKFWLRVNQYVNTAIDEQNNGNIINVYISTSDESDPADIGDWNLVDTIKTATTITRYSSVASIVLGSDNDDNNKFNGYIYSVMVTNGIDSNDIRINLGNSNFKSVNTASITDEIGNIWTVNNTILYNKSGSYMYIPPIDTLSVLGDSFSTCFWINPKNIETYPILTKESPSVSSTSRTNRSIEIGLTENSNIYVKNIYVDEVISLAGITQDEWNFVVVAFNSDNSFIDIYINGELKTHYYLSIPFLSNKRPWLLGTNGENRFMGDGAYINGLGIFDYYLGSEDVKDIYRAGASLVNNRFPAVWTEEEESVWDAMLAISTADLGIFYFDYDGKFVYSNALNNYSSAFDEFYNPQWYFDDDVDIVSGDQSIALQSNKIIVRISNIDTDLNKREEIWSAPDGTSIVGSEIDADISETFTNYIIYRSKIVAVGLTTETIPTFFDSGYVKIDDEIIYYGRKDEFKLYDLKRGQFDTEPAAHSAGARLREVRVFNIEYSSKPSIVLYDPFITAVIYDKTVDIESWKPGAFGAELIISRNEYGDPYLIQKLVSTDPLSNLDNFLSVAGKPLVSGTSNETTEFEAAEYTDSIRRYGIKSVEITNRYINTHNSAKKFADYFLQHFKVPVPIVEVATMGNPLIQLGDRVKIVTFDMMNMSQKEFWVESISRTYDGGLQQTMVLRSVS